MKDAEKIKEGAKALTEAVCAGFDVLKEKHGAQIDDVTLLGVAERVANVSFNSVANGGFLFFDEEREVGTAATLDPNTAARQAAEEIEGAQEKGAGA